MVHCCASLCAYGLTRDRLHDDRLFRHRLGGHLHARLSSHRYVFCVRRPFLWLCPHATSSGTILLQWQQRSARGCCQFYVCSCDIISLERRARAPHTKSVLEQSFIAMRSRISKLLKAAVILYWLAVLPHKRLTYSTETA